MSTSLFGENFAAMPDAEFDGLCARRVSTLRFEREAVRIANVFDNAKIITVGQLVRKAECELLKNRDFGKKSLQSIKNTLNQMDVCLGMWQCHVGPKELETFKQLYVTDLWYQFEARFERVMSDGGITWQLGIFFPRRSLERKLPKLLKEVHLQGQPNTASTRAQIQKEFILKVERMFKENHIPWVVAP